PRQIDCKVRSLQRSLRKKRTLSSSPISHIQHLEKAAQMAMSTNLLLQEEIKVLQAENKRKMKKKARRRVVLGSDLFISIQAGRDCIQQLDTHLEEPVEEQTSRPRQRAPARCSGCGTIGHTIRSCPSK